MGLRDTRVTAGTRGVCTVLSLHGSKFERADARPEDQWVIAPPCSTFVHRGFITD